MNNQRSLFGIRFSAICEVLAGLFILIVIDQFFGRGDMFWDVNPHPCE
jgi:hypothetical protein